MSCNVLKNIVFLFLLCKGCETAPVNGTSYVTNGITPEVSMFTWLVAVYEKGHPKAAYGFSIIGKPAARKKELLPAGIEKTYKTRNDIAVMHIVKLTKFTNVTKPIYVQWTYEGFARRLPSGTSEKVPDCKGGLNETDAGCKQPTQSPSSTSETPIVQIVYCNLPPFPRNGSYRFVHSSRIPNPDTLVENSESLEFSCDDPYVLSGEAVVTCTSGEWLPKLPQCLKFAVPTDCSYIRNNISGIYEITPSGAEAFNVSCELNFLNSKWTVIQNRVDGHLDFYRSFKEYQNGFGDLDGEFWLGLDHIYEITKFGSFELFILLKDFKNQTKFARYGEFSISSPESGYRLKVHGYAGDAGDSLSSHSGAKFTTKDHDEDCLDKGNCAEIAKGAWWYTNCFESNLNGLYLGGPSNTPGMEWSGWHFDYSLKESKMLIRNTDAQVPPGVLERVMEVTLNEVYPEDCANIQSNTSGIFKIQPKGSSSPFSVFCDMNLLNTKWIVIQNRMDGKVNFYRKYKDYEQGFGDLSGEHWLGLQQIHEITKNGIYELYIELSDFANGTRYANFGLFSLNSSSDGYRLIIDDYVGDAGDSLTFHNGMKFSTYDHDVDSAEDSNCAQAFQGAWWFDRCFKSHLNGPYLHGSTKIRSTGITWDAWKGLGYSLKSTRMLIRNADAGKNSAFYKKAPEYPKDCSDVTLESSGVFKIQPNKDVQPFEVYCDFALMGKKWTVIQNRFDGEVDFLQKFVHYQRGFGHQVGEHWLGLDYIYEITKQGGYNLYINVTDWDNNSRYAHYEDFSITSREDGYRLKIGKYSGNAGDSLRGHDGLPFSTTDHDADTWDTGNCADKYKGGWWFYNCHESNLNGVYYSDGANNTWYGLGVTWFGWRENLYYSYKATKMLITKK